MKKPLFILTGTRSLSCSRKDISTPGAAYQNLSYKEENIVVQNVLALPLSGTITVTYSTVHENNVQRIALMSGATASSFCTTPGINTAGNSLSVKSYSFRDSNVKGGTVNYMLRFEDDLGKWIYSDYNGVRIN